MDNCDDRVCVDHANGLADFQRWLSGLGGDWIFRGQSTAGWPLDTSIDRATRRLVYLQAPDIIDYPIDILLADEKMMLEEFQEAAHQFLSRIPRDGEVVEWMALLQHYGGATRLLDWTYSPYVALFFAVENLPEDGCSHHAVWAISLKWLKSASRKLLGGDDDFFLTSAADDPRKHADRVNEILKKSLEKEDPVPSAIVPVVGRRLNKRQLAQQGIFLFPSGHSQFRPTLAQMMPEPPPVAHAVLRKLLIPSEARLELLRGLMRMNITAASLFPGIEGFSRSLKARLELRVEDRRQIVEAKRT